MGQQERTRFIATDQLHLSLTARCIELMALRSNGPMDIKNGASMERLIESMALRLNMLMDLRTDSLMESSIGMTVPL